MSEIRKDPAFSGAGESSEQIQGHTSETQIERLQDQLADLLYPSDGGEIDSEALGALLEQLEAVSPLPASLPTDPEEGLKRFRRRYASVIEAADAGVGTGTPAVPEKRHSIKPFAKALPFAAALILLLGTMTAQAFGVDVFSAIARWTSEIFRLDGGSVPYAAVTVRPLEEGEEATYESLEEAVAAFGIDAPIVPKEIPERFELVRVTAACHKIGILIYADYESEDGYLQIRYNEAEAQGFSALEKENGDVDSHIVKGIDHRMASDLERQKAIWHNGDFECRITGDVSEQEIKSMIDSIYKE
ncbi:DUF4367 domain-containing protein [uncultured Oscillibacter sp.]|uniref:DUF4367 domain-containing protein n=1 Tax=uncultured Oscillibacter sp. TaxID=876091 RepID=UPI002625CFE4|nr:DUF4367 domain-containing protein [uncultured Oscillibacter sp.]